MVAPVASGILNLGTAEDLFSTPRQQRRTRVELFNVHPMIKPLSARVTVNPCFTIYLRVSPTYLATIAQTCWWHLCDTLCSDENVSEGPEFYAPLIDGLRCNGNHVRIMSGLSLSSATLHLFGNILVNICLSNTCESPSVELEGIEWPDEVPSLERKAAMHWAANRRCQKGEGRRTCGGTNDAIFIHHLLRNRLTQPHANQRVII